MATETDPKMKRILDMMLLTAFYLFVFGGASLAYWGLSFTEMHYLLKLLICDVAATVAIFIIGLFKKTASVYDPYWSVQTFFLVLIFLTGERIFHPIMLVVLLPLTYYTLRLTIHFGTTFSGFDYVDWRYASLKEKTGKAYFLVNLFGIDMMPTLLVFGLSVPLFVFLANASALMEGKTLLTSILTPVYAVLSCGAVTLSMIADLQLRKFRRTPDRDRSETCQIGLWHYSRHPNYLGEISFWTSALVLIGLLPDYWWCVFFPISLICLFLGYSIPSIEKRMIGHRPSYLKYKKEVSPLLLLPRRKSKEIEGEDRYENRPYNEQ